MRISTVPAFALSLCAIVTTAPSALAGRRPPETPIVITPPPGEITVHAETPAPSRAPAFATPKGRSKTSLPAKPNGNP